MTDITNTNANTGPTNNEICDRTGFRVPRGQLVRQWDGLMVRRESWERRHPQDFVRATSDRPKGSPRPEQTETFVQDNDQVSLSDL